MTVKQQLIAEISEIENPLVLNQIFEIMQLIRKNIKKNDASAVLARFSNCLDDADAQEMRAIINQEFNSIEGDW